MLIPLLEATLVAVHMVALVAACHALLTKRDPRSALGWTVALIFLPVFGLATYMIFGISRAQSRAELILSRISLASNRYALPAREEGEPSGEEARVLARLGHKLAATSLRPGNLVEPLHNGDEAYPAMLRAIGEARNHVFLSTYIFNYGEVALKFIAALEAAHKRGVDVRVLVDGVGALYSWRKPWKILMKKGVRTGRFRPPSLIPLSLGINLRSHRKVLVCDSIGFTGGMNIADGNVLARHSRHPIQDMQFRFEGPVVRELARAFLTNWAFCTGEYSPFPLITEKMAGECMCRVVADGPGGDADALNDLICGAIDISRHSVRIMTPYFLPTHDLMSALRAAAQRGVDVRIVLPERNNLFYMNWAMERLLPTMLAAGARVWRQKPPFAHTKLLTMDGFYSLVGSANMDSRSLRLNFELNMEIFDMRFHDRLSAFMDAAIAAGSEVTLDGLLSQHWSRKLLNSAAWVFSPYL